MGKTIKLKNNIFLDYLSVNRNFQQYRKDTTGLNLNNFQTDGIYLLNECDNLVNAPETYIDGLLEVTVVKNHANVVMITHKIFNRSSAKIYFRCYWFGAFWTSWNEL